MIEIFEDSVWQMSLGERAAVEGVLCQLRPALAIEIGSAEGASLARIAAHADEVHSFDLVPPSLDVPNRVTLHTGDSHVLLNELLQTLEAQGRNVDFVLVDGDHSEGGVRRDIEDVLNSRAVQRTIIVIHDVNNEQVRRGVDAVRYAAWPKVAYAELDWVPGYMFRQESLRHELWGGLGLVVVDATRQAYLRPDVVQRRYYEAAPLFAQIRDLIAAREAASANGDIGPGVQEPADVDALRDELARAQAVAESELRVRRAMERSPSWRLTAPLRAAKRRMRRAVS